MMGHSGRTSVPATFDAVTMKKTGRKVSYSLNSLPESQMVRTLKNHLNPMVRVSHIPSDLEISPWGIAGYSGEFWGKAGLSHPRGFPKSLEDFGFVS